MAYRELPPGFEEELDREERRLWQEVAIAVARSDAAKEPRIPVVWANAVAAAYREKYRR